MSAALQHTKSLPHYPNLDTKYHRHHARKAIPKAAQPMLGGRKCFRMVMPQRDKGLAYIYSKPIVAEWERVIAAALAAKGDHMQEEILRFRSDYEKFKGKPLDLDGARMVDEMIEWLLKEHGGLSVAAQPLVLAQYKGSVEAVLQALPHPDAGVLAHRQIVGVADTRTPFLTHWKEFLEKATITKAMKYRLEKDIPAFAAACKLSLEELETTINGQVNTAGMAEVQKYIDDIRVARNLTSGTLKHYVTRLNRYWKWLLKRGKVKTEGWFHHRDTADGRMVGDEAPKGRRGAGLAFVARDVPRVWRAALGGDGGDDGDGDFYVFATAKIVAYSGLRRSGVCSLRPESIKFDEETGIRCFDVSEKTEAGVRLVPIHPRLDKLVDFLLLNPDQDGYLIHDAGDNLNLGTRGHNIGDRLRPILEAMGFKGRGLHSIRKSFAQQLEDVPMPATIEREMKLKVIKNLMGHAVKDQTVGVGKSRYGKLRPLTERRDLLFALSYPGEDDMITGEF